MSAPFRIHRPPLEATAATPATSQDSIKNWMERLIKLIPSEVVAVYLAGKNLAQEYLIYWSVVCLGVVVVIRIWGTTAPTRGPQFPAVLISAVSYILWVLAIGGFPERLVPPNLVALSILVWTAIVPVLYKGD